MNCVQFSLNCRYLNRQIDSKPYPMTKISKIVLTIEGFKLSMSLDLIMICYHIQLSEDAINLCTMILP